MLSLEQVKHILTYYFLDMIPNYDKNTPVHVHRDCVYLNKTRGELCSDIYSNPKLVHVISSIHIAGKQFFFRQKNGAMVSRSSTEELSCDRPRNRPET